MSFVDFWEGGGGGSPKSILGKSRSNLTAGQMSMMTIDDEDTYDDDADDDADADNGDDDADADADDDDIFSPMAKEWSHQL